MINVSFAVTVVFAALAQTSSPHYTPGKMALDMNVECVSLLGKNLYREPGVNGEDVGSLERHLAEAQKHAAAQADNPAVHIELGHALEAVWRYHDAAQAYTRAIALEPTDASAYVLRGNTFLILRLFVQARADFEHATAIDPVNYDAWYGLGLGYWLSGSFEKSAAAFAKAFNLGGNPQQVADAGELNNLAAARTGKEDLKVVLGGPAAKRPADDPFTAYLASLNKQVNDKAGAVEDWKAIAASPDWTQLGVVAAEAEIAAVEGSKKMSNSRAPIL